MARKGSSKLAKIECEICGENDKSVLHIHHLIEQHELDCTNHPYNCLVVCSNCHNRIHAQTIEIIGVFPGTKPPSGRIIVYKKENGELNYPELIGITPPYQYKPNAMKVK